MFVKQFCLRVCAAIVGCAMLLLPSAFGRDVSTLVPVGVARVDITPTGPVRLAGYASREVEVDTVGHATLGEGPGHRCE